MIVSSSEVIIGLRTTHGFDDAAPTTDNLIPVSRSRIINLIRYLKSETDSGCGGYEGFRFFETLFTVDVSFMTINLRGVLEIVNTFFQLFLGPKICSVEHPKDYKNVMKKVEKKCLQTP